MIMKILMILIMTMRMRKSKTFSAAPAKSLLRISWILLNCFDMLGTLVKLACRSKPSRSGALQGLVQSVVMSVKFSLMTFSLSPRVTLLFFSESVLLLITSSCSPIFLASVDKKIWFVPNPFQKAFGKGTFFVRLSAKSPNF